MGGVVGIDVGLQGGIGIITDDLIVSFSMPLLGGVLDLKHFRDILNEYKEVDKVFIEDVHAIFGSSAKNTFNFGRVCGQIEATISALQLPFEFVKPKVWQKPFFEQGKGLSPKERKERCVLAAKRLWPKYDLRENDRCRTPHLGIVDALLIAEYGRRTL